MSEEQTAPESRQPDTATEAPARASAEGATRNLDVILDLDLPLTVRFGRTQMALGALVQIGPGSVVNLDRSPADPVDVLVNGKVIARGDVVSVAGHYGVRITDIVSPSERIPQYGG